MVSLPVRKDMAPIMPTRKSSREYYAGGSICSSSQSSCSDILSMVNAKFENVGNVMTPSTTRMASLVDTLGCLSPLPKIPMTPNKTPMTPIRPTIPLLAQLAVDTKSDVAPTIPHRPLSEDISSTVSAITMEISYTEELKENSVFSPQTAPRSTKRVQNVGDLLLSVSNHSINTVSTGSTAWSTHWMYTGYILPRIM